MQNPRIIVIQKLYSYHFNKDEKFNFPKHRFKKFIKDVVKGTIERKDLINELMKNEISKEIDTKRTDLLIKIICTAAVFELMYKPETATKIIINEYLLSGSFFLRKSQTKFLNAILDKISKKIRH